MVDSLQIREFVDSLPIQELAMGLVVGGLVSVVWVLALPRSSLRWLPSVAAVTSAIAAKQFVDPSWPSWVGLILLVVGATVESQTGKRFSGFTLLALGAGFLAVGVTKYITIWWYPTAIVAGALLLHFSCRPTALRSPGPLLPFLWSASAAGIFLAVPDTEGPSALLGVLGILTLMALAARGPVIDTSFAPLAAAVLSICALGATTRPVAFIAALGCLGLLLTGPLSLPRRSSESLNHLQSAGLVVLQAIFAIGLARWIPGAGGPAEATLRASAGLLVLTGVAALWLVAVHARQGVH